MSTDELFDRCRELAMTEPSAAALRFMHETLVLCCGEALRQTGTGFGNLFAQVDYLCKHSGLKTGERMAVQQMRRRSNHTEVPEREQWMQDVRTLTLFISAVFKTAVPDALVRLIPHQPPSLAADTSTFKTQRSKYIRCIVSQWDEQLSFLDDPYNLDQLQQLIKARAYKSDFIRTCRLHRSSGLPQFETIFWSHMMLNNGLAVMPVRNQINNIGAMEDSAHYSALKTLPKAVRRIFTMQRYELSFPLRHPKYVVDNVAYQQRMYRYNAWDHPWIKISRSFEELFLNLCYGNISQITRSLTRRIRKWLGIDTQI